ncbi:hypothetical protein CKA32_005858 [Geitlerinema sp. FC II]|nr:hypothetical protein CKA32_005858 [Geitlerinema sp. FC II]
MASRTRKRGKIGNSWGASQFCKNISFGWQNSRLALPV